MSRRAAALLALALVCPARRAAAACGPPGPGPRLGLVLSGGGARGLAHVGAIKALEEQGVRPDCIAGTSMGALIGALYASGYPAARIEQIVRSVDWQRIHSGRTERPLVPVGRRMDDFRPLVRLGFGFWRLQLPRAAEPDFRLRRFLVALLTAPALRAGRDFDRLPIPFRAVAADLETGERVVLSSGSLEAAVRASVSAPVTLEPVRDGERWLVDGGVADNLPVGVARGMGADVVIAVDVRSPPARPRPESNAVEVAGVLADALIRRRNEDFRAEPDLVVRPALEGLLNTDYAAFERAIAEGYTAARAQTAEIADALRRPVRVAAAGTDGHAAGTDGHAGTDDGADAAAGGAQRVSTVRVEGEAATRESVVRAAFALREGEPFDLQAALRGLDAVWATRLFRSAWLDVVPAAGGLEVVVHVREAEKRVAELAARFDETDKAEGVVRLRDVNVFGRGETLELLGRASDARTGLELGFGADGVLGSPLGYFVRGSVSEWRPRPFRGGEPLPRAEFDRTSLAGGLQTHPVPSLLLRAGFERAHVGTAAHPEAGLAAGDTDIATVGALLAWDSLDDLWDPRRGVLALAQADRGLDALGGSERYWRAFGTLRVAVSPGRAGTLQLDALGFTSGDGLPPHEQVQFGGPVLVPGLARDELWGPHGFALALSHRLTVIGRLQVIARAGLGGVWEDRSEMSVSSARRGYGLGLRHPTPVGPIALEWGREGGSSRVYVSIGYR